MKITLLALATTLSFSAFSAITDYKEIKQLGFNVLNEIKLSDTKFKDLSLIRIGNDWVFSTPGSTLVIKGDVIDLSTRSIVTGDFKKDFYKPIVDGFPESMKIIYKPKGEIKSVINVLTDTSCPFCKKLHKEIPELNNAGIQVNYIPFVRGYTKGAGYKPMLSAWCAENPKEEFERIISGKRSSENKCLTQSLIKGYNLASKLGADGTPATFLQDGRSISGYTPAKTIIDAIFKKNK